MQASKTYSLKKDVFYIYIFKLNIGWIAMKFDLDIHLNSSNTLVYG